MFLRELWLLLLFCVINVSSLVAQERYALIIGIGDYPEESGWSKINGDKDIDIITKFLQANKFHADNIITFQNAAASKDNILRGFNSLIVKARPNDKIYIHFSGHGQQITDLYGDEADGYDEAWVPYDALKHYIPKVYEGENHLIDDEINILLSAIRQKIGASGELIVVVDACHSGDSSRGEDEENEIIIRGTADRFIIPHTAPAASIEPKPIQWTIISACKSYQNNYECKIDGQHFGSLSYALYTSRNEMGNSQLDRIGEMLADKVSNLVPWPQTVQIESAGADKTQRIFKSDE